MSKPEIVVVNDPAALAREAAQRFESSVQAAVLARGRFSVALSGGSTPGELYRRLASVELPWQQIHLFWGDERCVPPDDPGSCYRLARETLIDHVPIPGENVHRVRGELAPAAAAQDYAAQLEAFFGGRPRFDLILLGMGTDGHTASLFPDSPALHEERRTVVPVTAQYQDRPAHRVTLSPPTIKAARRIFFLVAGASKAPIAKAVLTGPPGRYPAQLVRPTAGQVLWLLDQAAASLLEKHR